MNKRLKKLIFFLISSIVLISVFILPSFTAASKLNVNDFKIKYDKVEIDSLNETKQSFIKKIPGGSWANDENYSWKDGEAEFRNDILLRFRLFNYFTTSRGVTKGTSLDVVKNNYPETAGIESGGKGAVEYYYTGEINKMNCAIGFNIKHSTQKVHEIIVEVIRN